MFCDRGGAERLLYRRRSRASRNAGGKQAASRAGCTNFIAASPTNTPVSCRSLRRAVPSQAHLQDRLRCAVGSVLTRQLLGLCLLPPDALHRIPWPIDRPALRLCAALVRRGSVRSSSLSLSISASSRLTSGSLCNHSSNATVSGTSANASAGVAAPRTSEPHQSYAMVFASCMCAGAPSKDRPGYPHPLSRHPGGPAPIVEARDRWLVKPIRTTRKDPDELVRLSRAECLARRQDRVSAPETRAGRMATSARMTLGQESIASDAESYQRGLWRRPDPRITAGLVATACALLPIRFRPRDGFERARRPLPGRGVPPAWGGVLEILERRSLSHPAATPHHFRPMLGGHLQSVPRERAAVDQAACAAFAGRAKHHYWQTPSTRRLLCVLHSLIHIG